MENIKTIRSPKQKITFTLRQKSGLAFDLFTISEVFIKFFSNLANNLV